MNRNRLAHILVRGLHLFIIAALLAVALSVPTAPVGATPPISGNTISFGSKQEVGSGTYTINAVVVADLDNDGKADLASGSTSAGGIDVWQNDGTPFDGLWSTYQGVGTGGLIYGLVAGDLNQDGRIDLVSGGSSYDPIIWKNDGTPFNDAWSTNLDLGNAVGEINGVAVADLDSDGNLDVVIGSEDDGGAGNEVIAWKNPWTSSTDPFANSWTQKNVGDHNDKPANSVAVCDIDSDGDTDVVAGYDESTDEEVVVWENQGSWSFQKRVVGETNGSTHVYSVACGDFNADGKLDIAHGS